MSAPAQQSSPLSREQLLASLLKLAAANGAAPGETRQAQGAAPQILREWVPRITRALLSDGPQGQKARAAARLVIEAGRDLFAAARALENEP